MRAARPRRPWTMKEVLELCRRKRAGETLAAIAADTGRNVCNCQRYWSRYGEARRYGSAERSREAVLRLHAEGRSARDCAAGAGCSTSTAAQILRDAGLRPNGLAPASRARAGRKFRAYLDAGGWSKGDHCAERLRREAGAMGWPEASSPQQARLLAALLSGGESSAAALAEALGAGTSGVRHLLRHLLLRGFAVRRRPAGGATYLYDLAPWLRARKSEGG